MTKEEFVRNGSWILKVIRDRCELTQAETDYLDCLIEVLEQEPCEDCVSREWVLEHQRIVADDDGIMLPVVDVSIVKKAPSVQPKPKYVAVGNVNFDKDELQKIIDEAILTIMPEIEYKKAHWQNNACSNCGIYNASAYKNWCPNCGCQMTEGTE